jgi:hypothetical protein
LALELYCHIGLCNLTVKLAFVTLVSNVRL